MLRIFGLIRFVLEPRTYLWVDAIFVMKTKRAVLIIFDGRKTWIPKAWIAQIKRNEGSSIKIKISDYYWAKKFT